MTKLKWDRQKQTSTLNSEYWTDPKKGFDKQWHEQRTFNLNKHIKETQSLGIHANHELERIKLDSGPHFGKLVCKTCNDKFLKWLSKNSF